MRSVWSVRKISILCLTGYIFICARTPVYGGGSQSRLSAVETLELAREIAKQEALSQKPSVIRRFDDHAYQPNPRYVPKAKISWEEIKTACGPVPEDVCIRKYYNDNL